MFFFCDFHRLATIHESFPPQNLQLDERNKNFPPQNFGWWKFMKYPLIPKKKPARVSHQLSSVTYYRHKTLIIIKPDAFTVNISEFGYLA